MLSGMTTLRESILNCALISWFFLLLQLMVAPIGVVGEVGERLGAGRFGRGKVSHVLPGIPPVLLHGIAGEAC
jgi:hypothetical protein